MDNIAQIKLFLGYTSPILHFNFLYLINKSFFREFWTEVELGILRELERRLVATSIVVQGVDSTGLRICIKLHSTYLIKF